MLLAAASYVDVDIIEKGLHIKISERIRRLVTTLVIIGIAIASVLIAIYPTAPMVVLSFEFTFPAYSVIAWPIIIMIFWPRANKYGGLASYLAGFISLLLFTYVIWPEYPHNPFGLWAGTLPTLVAVVTLIVVSLLTPPPPKEHLREFYGS
jgi:Na+/proline symporter